MRQAVEIFTGLLLVALLAGVLLSFVPGFPFHL